MRLLAVFTAAVAVALPARAADVSFKNLSATLPFNHVYGGGWEHFVGGGIAVFDCNGDRFPDGYMAGGENKARLIVNTTKAPGEVISFIEPEQSGLDLTGVTGAYPLDIDGDAQMDLFVMRVGANKVFKGLVGCKFQDVTDEWGLTSGDRWTTSFSATWEAGQDWPTLAVGNYVDRKNPDGPFGTCDVNELHRPQGRIYGQPEELKPGFCALSMLISDWTRTGRRDLRISNDRHYYVTGGEEQMLRLDQMRFLTAEDGWRPISIWGMGIASQDINHDSYPDVVLTSMGDQLMQFVEGGTHLVDAPFSIGAYAHIPYVGDDGRPSTGWHAQFGDVNNDGLDDLFIAKGNVDQMPSNAMKDPNNMLLQQADGTFAERGLEAGIATLDRSRGAAVTDFNLDGKLDLAVVNRRAAMEIYQNVTTDTGHFVSVEPRMEGGNRFAVGTWVELRTPDGKVQSHEVTVGGGHAGGQAGPLHFGLGNSSEAQLRFIWPDGETSVWIDAMIDRQLIAKRGEGRAVALIDALK